ncbi:MAG TPA: DUF1549 domain-containing protein [Candidatus Binatia bacterium]|nr:DUF1549 domain-containing protein [Candidatus Binatia bacterium]
MLLGVVLGAALLATSARADLTASYDGTLTLRRRHPPAVVAGALAQTGAAVSGTLAIALPAPAGTAVYHVNGRARRARVTLTGTSSTGVRFRWRGRANGTTVLGIARLAGRTVHAKGMLALARRIVQPPATPPATCDSSFFDGRVMGLVLQPICAGCHVPGGAAAATGFRVTLGDPRATQASVALMIDTARPEQSRILQKPLAELPHGGGQQLSPGSEAAAVLAQWVQLVASGQQCNGAPSVPMAPIPPAELLVRAAMDLRGTRPAPAELDAVEADPSAYEAIVDGYLHSPEFLERVKDVYDDALLVRREDENDSRRDETAAIYGEALELIAWIVANDRPFTEIGTADYTVANALFQSDPDRMPYPMEPVVGAGWQPSHYLDGRPHAGLLSTSAFYEVWDTNDTNKNRRRANRWSIVFHCYNFLDTPVDVTRNVDNADADAVLNAVTTRADCKACHDRLDPLASFLFPMDDAGLETDDAQSFYRGDPERWRRANKRPPAVYGVPGGDIRDLGRLLTTHPKFAECQTKRAFQLLFLRAPKTSLELETAAGIAARWPTEDGYDFRKLVKRWMLSGAYRSMPVDGAPEWVRRTSPERLERLIADLTGFVWTRDPRDDGTPPRTEPVPLLTSDHDGFEVILGGIDGVSVSGRSDALNASVAVVQRKVAALAADFVVQTDLALPDGARRLLHGVTGTEDPNVDDAVLRAVLAALVRRLYGERVATTDPQVDAWVGLYRALWTDTSESGTGRRSVPGTRGERAWRGLVTAMLRSPRILLY